MCRMLDTNQEKEKKGRSQCHSRQVDGYGGKVCTTTELHNNVVWVGSMSQSPRADSDRNMRGVVGCT